MNTWNVDFFFFFIIWCFERLTGSLLNIETHGLSLKIGFGLLISVELFLMMALGFFRLPPAKCVFFCGDSNYQVLSQGLVQWFPTKAMHETSWELFYKGRCCSLPRTTDISLRKQSPGVYTFFSTPQVFFIKRKGLKPRKTILLDYFKWDYYDCHHYSCLWLYQFNFVRIFGNKSITLWASPPFLTRFSWGLEDFEVATESEAKVARFL